MNALAVCLIIACLAVAPVVDGIVSDGEWAEATEPIPMYQAGDPDKPILAELRLGGWVDGRLYGLVEAVDGHQVHACGQPEEYWIKLNSVAYELTLAFVNEADCLADGFEFSAEVAQGDHALVAHANFDKARDTGQTPETEICIYCPPTAVLGTVSNVRAWHTRPERVVLQWTQEVMPGGFTLIARDDGSVIGAADCARTCVFIDRAAPAKAAYTLTLTLGMLRDTFGPYAAGWPVFLPAVPMGRVTSHTYR